jgi:hypothetical protein
MLIYISDLSVCNANAMNVIDVSTMYYTLYKNLIANFFILLM